MNFSAQKFVVYADQYRRSETEGKGLPVVAFHVDPRIHHDFDELSISSELHKLGWVVPAYSMAASCHKLKLLRVVCRCDFSRSRCDRLIEDMQLVLKALYYV